MEKASIIFVFIYGFVFLVSVLTMLDVMLTRKFPWLKDKDEL